MKRKLQKKCVLKIKVSPKASRSAIGPWHGDVLKICVTAAPERGKANAAVCAMLARHLGVAKSHCRIIRGQSSPIKKLQIDLDCGLVRQRLEAPDSWSYGAGFVP